MLRFFLIGYANKNTAGFVQIFVPLLKRSKTNGQMFLFHKPVFVFASLQL